jgi:N6-adenosine-specific RNA methylase IME4
MLPPPPRAGSYGTIYADPPWRWQPWSAKGNDRAPPYDTMSVDEMLEQIPLGQWAAREARLFMWISDADPAGALRLAAGWGFPHFSTVAFVWVKTTVNGKPWVGKSKVTLKGSEQCWLFWRRRFGRQSRDERQVIVAPVEPRQPGRRQHSTKPVEAYGRIERLVEGPYLEVFARRRHPGWDGWGDELEVETHGPAA